MLPPATISIYPASPDPILIHYSLLPIPCSLFPKEKKRALCPLLTLFIAKLLCLDCDDFTAVVGAASLAGSVGQTGLTALGASDDTGDRQLPVGVTSLISSCFGNFSLGYCHFGTPPWFEMPQGINTTCSKVAAKLPIWDPDPVCSCKGHS